MAHIIRLDDKLSNKIAAGEVVERPASVVKELAENAVDAEASHVTIDIEEGGLSKIKVLDNGKGVSREDAELAFRRHATSKIKNEHDLFQVHTLGFRGEALPSIASVSRTEMTTSTGDEAGTHLIVEGGYVTNTQSSSARRGTEIVVRQLFFNTPARLKHLKTVHTEWGNITNTVYRMALANPGISFHLVHNNKKTFQTNGNGDMLQVIAAIYGKNTAKKMVPIRTESLDYTISGFIAKPEVTRASRQHMSLFMNGRYIRNYPVIRAILEGYHTLLPVRRYPIAMIHVDMDPTLIDVNVHPSKLEVRLSKEKELCQLIESVTKETLGKLQLIPETMHAKKNDSKTHQQQLTFDGELKNRPSEVDTGEQKVDASEGEEIKSDDNVAEAPSKEANTLDTNAVPLTREALVPYEQTEETSENDTDPDDISDLSGDPDDIQATTKPSSDDNDSRVPTFYPIGQMQGTYILAHNDHGLYIIDQHAAQERIKYEFYREKVGEVYSEVQELLVPLTFEFSSVEAAIIEENRQTLENVGIFLEPFGSATFLVRSHPSWFPEGIEKETVEDIIYQVIEEKKADIKKLREDAAILMSCKRSIKANQHLQTNEQVALLEQLRQTTDPFTCPHGRPIIIHFSTYEMEKMFKRVM